MERREAGDGKPQRAIAKALLECIRAQTSEDRCLALRRTVRFPGRAAKRGADGNEASRQAQNRAL